MRLRIYLTGRLSVEAGDSLTVDSKFPSRQSRLAFAYLCLHQDRSVPRDELADAIWPDELPAAWETSLSAVVSKLRTLLKGTLHVNTSAGAYQLRPDSEPWIDVEVAQSAIDQAEGLLRGVRPREAWGPANVAATISSRPFFPREEIPWIERQRQALHETRVRSLECLTTLAFRNREMPLAARLGSAIVEEEPFRESAYRHLMRVHEAMGNRAEALRVYESCQRILKEELGVPPSSETQTLYRSLSQGSDH